MKIGPIPMVPPSGNAMRRKYRDRFAYRDLRAIWGHNIRAFLPPGSCQANAGQKMLVRITIEHERLYDADNAISGCKPLLDTLKWVGIIKDDSPDWMELDVRQVKSKKSQTTIEIGPC